MGEGWGWPGLSRKAHYFIDGKSLCNKWLYLHDQLWPENDNSPDNCAVCRRKLEKQRSQEAPDA